VTLSPWPSPDGPTEPVGVPGETEVEMQAETGESRAAVRESGARVRVEEGATTAEYAVCTGAGVGFAGILFKFLTSDFGQQFLKSVWNGIKGLLPF
jgi:hypothetical protein